MTNTKQIPRLPTEEEKQQLAVYIESTVMIHPVDEGTGRAMRLVNQACITVFDNYQGYYIPEGKEAIPENGKTFKGKVMIVIWINSWMNTDTFIWERGHIVEVEDWSEKWKQQTYDEYFKNR